MADDIDSKAFSEMQYATTDKTAVNLFGDKSKVTKENVHDMLMAAGFTPGLGNIADAADALLYATEGEFGSAALSAVAMIPFIGQAVSAKKALKIAKESGEEMVTLYRGVDKWHPGKMVKEGKFVGGGEYISKKTLGKDRWHGAITSKNPDALWTSMHKGWVENWIGKSRNKRILEFEVPWSYAEKHGIPGYNEDDITFALGLPKEFLKKVHK